MSREFVEVLEDVFAGEKFEIKGYSDPLIVESDSFCLYWMLDSIYIQTKLPHPLIEAAYFWKEEDPDKEEFKHYMTRFRTYLSEVSSKLNQLVANL